MCADMKVAYDKQKKGSNNYDGQWSSNFFES